MKRIVQRSLVIIGASGALVAAVETAANAGVVLNIHTEATARGTQVVVVITGGGPVVVGGDVSSVVRRTRRAAHRGQLRVGALDPELVSLAAVWA